MKNIVQQTTSNYDKFEFNEINRVLVKGGVFQPRKDLLISMKHEGYRKAAPIACVITKQGKLRIINGHNRFITAKFLGLPVEYIAYPETDDVNPVEWSKQEKQWTTDNYVSSYAHMGNEDYVEVMDYSRFNDIPLNASFSMFAGESSSSNNSWGKVKQGTFVIKDRVQPLRVGRIVRELVRYCDFTNKSMLVHAVSKSTFIPEFDDEKMLERIHKHNELLKKCRTVDEYIEMLDLVYNRNAKGTKLFFKIEVSKIMTTRRSSLRKSRT